MADDTSRTAVVTGAGTGIGRGIAGALVADGYRVIAVGRRPEPLQAAADELNAGSGRRAVTVFPCDLTDLDGIGSLAEHVEAEVGPLDVLVNNAGGADRRPLNTLADVAGYWLATLQQNLLSAVLVTEALKPLLRRPGGRVIAISSGSARGKGGNVAYASAKAAMNRWIISLATELGADGITANVVVPGFVPDTGLYGTAGVSEARRASLAEQIAVGRVGTPDDIGAMVRFLASPDSSWVTGAAFDVDGGQKVTRLG